MALQLVGPLYIATTNKGKLREIEELVFEYFPAIKEVRGRPAKKADETEKTFVGNALIKARALAKEILLESPELPEFAVLADDSGIAVDALGGAPGVHSARYAGDHVEPEAHMQKLLKELDKKQVPPDKRSAHYHCALALIVINHGRAQEFIADGTCDGLIVNHPIGSSGFGYDPIFYSPHFGKTMAEVSYAEKNSISHRRNAFEKLKAQFLN